MKKSISLTFHGVLDYAMAVLLLAGPYLFGLDGNGPDSIVLYAAGGATIVYSLVTDYQLGLVKIIPMKAHLILDLLSGIMLAGSPWLFGFADRVFLPHFILGLIEILVMVMTNTSKKEPPNRLIET